MHTNEIDRGEVHAEFWWGNLRGSDHLEDVAIYGKIILKRSFKRYGGGRGLD
jgi:hypothetical protein